MADQPQSHSPSNDLLAIRALRESVPFNAYFMRRIKQRRDELQESYQHDGPEKVDKEQREVIRQILLQYEWIITRMMGEDEAAAKNEATQPRQDRIGQSG